MCSTILELLKSREFEAIGACDGSRGVQLATELVPDLIVCDVRMPGLDGYGVLSALRTDPIAATIPFIFLTAQTSQADFYQRQSLKADGYVAKPFKFEQLLAAIAQLQAEQ